MKKQIKRVVMGTVFDGAAMEKYLEKMALKGWMLTSVRGIFWYFEACEPKRVRFQVDCFDKASEFDIGPERNTREYIEYCEMAGWKYLHSMGKMQIFYTEDMEIPEIQTDDKLKLKSLWKGTLLNLIIFLVLGIENIWQCYVMNFGVLFADQYYFFSKTITSASDLGMGAFNLGFGILLLGAAGRILFYFIRNGVRVYHGGKIVNYGYKSTKAFYGIYMAICILYIVWLFILSAQRDMGWIAVTLLVTLVILIGGYVFLTSRKWFNQTYNIVASVLLCVAIFGAIGGIIGKEMISILTSGSSVTVDGITYSYSQDELPLYLDDLGYEKEDYDILYEDSYMEEAESPFGQKYEYSTSYMLKGEESGPNYGLTIFSGKFLWVTNRYNDLLLNDSRVEITEGPQWAKELWGSERVYFLDTGYICQLCVMTDEYTVLIEGVKEEQQVKKLKEAYGL